MVFMGIIGIIATLIGIVWGGCEWSARSEVAKRVFSGLGITFLASILCFMLWVLAWLIVDTYNTALKEKVVKAYKASAMIYLDNNNSSLLVGGK